MIKKLAAHWRLLAVGVIALGVALWWPWVNHCAPIGADPRMGALPFEWVEIAGDRATFAARGCDGMEYSEVGRRGSWSFLWPAGPAPVLAVTDKPEGTTLTLRDSASRPAYPEGWIGGIRCRFQPRGIAFALSSLEALFTAGPADCGEDQAPAP